MASSARNQQLQEWGSIAAAIALGPAFVVLGYQLGLVFRPAAVAGALVCALVVPLLTTAGGRFKLVVWQIAVISMIAAVIGDDVRGNAMPRGRANATLRALPWLLSHWRFGSGLGELPASGGRVRYVPGRYLR